MSVMGLAGFAEGFANAQQMKKERARIDKMNEQQDRMLAIMEKNPGAFSGSMGIPGMGDGSGGGGGAGGARSYAAMPVEASYIRDGLVKRGMDPHIADGFVMNFKDESAFNASAVGDNGNAFGLAQWNGPRMRALYAYADEKGVSAADPDLQMDFLMHELGGSHSTEWGKIQGAKTAGEAGVLIVNHFEKPAEKHRAARAAAYSGATPSYVGGAPEPETTANNVATVKTYAGAEKPGPAVSVAGVTPQDVARVKAFSPAFAAVPGQTLRFGIDEHKKNGGQILPPTMGIGVK